MHRRKHKDAQVSTVIQEGGFSEIEKRSSRDSQEAKRREQEPAISYDSHSKNFVVGCNCGKEKFVFNTKTDTVESENTVIKMKEMDPYKKREQNEDNTNYGRSQGGYSNSPQSAYGQGPTPKQSYGQQSQGGYNRGF